LGAPAGWPLARGLAVSRTVDPSSRIPDPDRRQSFPGRQADRGSRRVGSGEQPAFDGMRTARCGVGEEARRSGNLSVWLRRANYRRSG